MLPRTKVIYIYKRKANRKKQVFTWLHKLGTAFVVVSLGGLTGPLTPFIRMEGGYYLTQAKNTLSSITIPTITLSSYLSIFPSSTPTPQPSITLQSILISPDGSTIQPINPDFSLIIPKIDVNAAVIESVNPSKPGEYFEALKTGVAHASTSFFPDEDGTVYLFSHSTNYDWFVKDLNAVFYLLKNLEKDDKIVIFYKNKQYNYKLTEKKIVNPTDISYLAPQPGAKRLILQTCWPPGDITQRLLILADLVD